MNSSRPLAVITGASSGIGAEFARQLHARGYSLLLVARREENLRAVAAAVGDAEILVADLATDAGVAAAAARIRAAANLELLVNNAGFGSRGGYFQTRDLALWDRMHRLHILATMRLTHAALPGMVERRRGGIINVSSVAAFISSPGAVCYHATKAWMNEFTEGIYQEMERQDSRVKIQALCPGFTYSEFHDVMGDDRSSVPKPWWLATDYVVAESLRGLDRGELFVIPSARYKAVVGFVRHMPRWLRHWIMNRFASRYRKPARKDSAA